MRHICTGPSISQNTPASISRLSERWKILVDPRDHLLTNEITKSENTSGMGPHRGLRVEHESSFACLQISAANHIRIDLMWRSIASSRITMLFSPSNQRTFINSGSVYRLNDSTKGLNSLQAYMSLFHLILALYKILHGHLISRSMHYHERWTLDLS
jgi:hypothetical protein